MVDLAVHVAEELADKPYTAVIYHFLDNNFYFTQSEDGSKRPAKKGPDGNYHFEGDVVLADKDGEFAILNLCEPLWEAAKGKNMVVVVPMARFITGSCCGDSTHAVNRSNNDFYTKMREELTASCRNIKDFLFTGGFRNGRLMDPARALLGLTVAEIWNSDPIHPKLEIYNIMAKSVIQVELTCGSGQTKRKRSQGHRGGNISGHMRGARF